MMKRFRMCCICLMLAVLAGCATFTNQAEDRHRMPAYQPVTGDIALVKSSGPPPASGGNATNAAARDADVVTNAVNATKPTQRILNRGDRIMISLRGIPRAEELKNVIDGTGQVTLPFIGQVQVAGLSPSEAERLIESIYIDEGYYRNINVIVVAEDKVYFVQGEVSRQGKFSMSGDVTLLQAITEAGGYSPFANKKNVKVIRGDQVLFFNARDIADGEKVDPAILADDIIVVQRSVF